MKYMDELCVESREIKILQMGAWIEEMQVEKYEKNKLPVFWKFRPTTYLCKSHDFFTEFGKLLLYTLSVLYTFQKAYSAR